MGQQQILLIILGSMIVGIATVLGINLASPDLSSIHYSMQIQWSEQDGAFVGTVPELPQVRVEDLDPSKAARALSWAMYDAVQNMIAQGQVVPTPHTLNVEPTNE